MLYTDETRRDILSRLSGYRLKHTLGCEKAARMLAQKYGADEDKCAFAMLQELFSGRAVELVRKIRYNTQ